MKRLLHALCWLVILVGCEAPDPTPEPERTFRAMTASMNALADSMQNVKDADSATAALGDLRSKFAAVSDTFQRLPIVMQDSNAMVIYLADKGTMAMRLQELKKSAERLTVEEDRIEKLPGLPFEFWKACMLCEIDVIQAGLAITQTPNAVEIKRFFKNVQDLYQKHPYEDILHVEVPNATEDLMKGVCDKLQKLAPDASLYRCEIEDSFNVILGPVKDFKAIASAVDFGKIALQNENKRYLKIELDWEKFATTAETAGEAAERKQEEAEDRAMQAAEAARQKLAEAERQRQEAEMKRIAEATKEPDPSDPDYYDKLVSQAASGDPTTSERAVDVLLTKSPSDVSSLDTRKNIARTFKKLAEGNGNPLKEKAIKGLVIWGGKYCGPILLKMLSVPNPAAEEQIIEALGEVKHVPAAPVLAARLGDQRLHQRVITALQQLGADAEDALIKVARSENQQASLAAVELLGDCGTKKCLPTLRKKVSNRKLQVEARDACKEAIRKITTRQKEAKTADT